MRPARMFLAIQATVLAVAALLHGGVFGASHVHREARIAEGLMAIVLALSLMAVVAQPKWTRRIGLASQTFALIGTLVGTLMMAMGIGPRSAIDIALHAGMIALLCIGLVTVARDPRRFVGRTLVRVPMVRHPAMRR